MQLVDAKGDVISVWTPEQYALVCKYASATLGTPFNCVPGECQSFTAQSFMWWLRQANSGFAAALAVTAVATQDKVEIYQAGLLVMILLDKVERAKFVPHKPLTWKIEELPRHLHVLKN